MFPNLEKQPERIIRHLKKFNFSLRKTAEASSGSATKTYGQLHFLFTSA